jgi:LEA14-like dessication related protein
MEMNFDPGVIEMTRIDALVMSSLTSSPRIVNIFGHCATSVATEDLVSSHQNIINFIRPYNPNDFPFLVKATTNRISSHQWNRICNKERN